MSGTVYNSGAVPSATRIELGFWHELRVSSPAQAEVRYQQIINDDTPVRLAELGQRLQNFVRDVRAKAPQVEIVEVGHSDGEPLYSRFGIAVAFPEELSRQLPETHRRRRRATAPHLRPKRRHGHGHRHRP